MEKHLIREELLSADTVLAAIFYNTYPKLELKAYAM
jgi:hypothetical protein